MLVILSRAAVRGQGTGTHTSVTHLAWDSGPLPVLGAPQIDGQRVQALGEDRIRAQPRLKAAGSRTIWSWRVGRTPGGSWRVQYRLPATGPGADGESYAGSTALSGEACASRSRPYMRTAARQISAGVSYWSLGTISSTCKASLDSSKSHRPPRRRRRRWWSRGSCSRPRARHASDARRGGRPAPPTRRWALPTEATRGQHHAPS